jgi:acetyl esterase/lipase
LTLDVDGGTAVADAAAQWKFANPNAGKSVADLPRATPLFLARAGQDQFPGLNAAMDRFVAAALQANLPLTLVNYPEAPHAFDLLLDTDTSREVVRQILAFMRFHLMH